MCPDWLLSILRWPVTMQPLERSVEGLRGPDGAVVPCVDGIPSLVFPPTLSGQDEKMNRLYERLAPFYALTEDVLGRLLTGIDMQRSRAEIVGLLGLRPGMRLLEVSPGPGVFQPMLRAAIGNAAPMCAVDLSLNMLRQCRKKHANLDIELIRGNGQHLPFADESFDALFHFGGINLFNEPQAALAEFVRVVRKGGIVAWGDEQMSENFRHPVGRRVLPRMNPGFRKSPPPVPGSLADVRQREVCGGLGYLVTAKRPR